jgi:hypothetical protein
MFLDQDSFIVLSVAIYFYFLEMCIKFLIQYFGPLLERKGNYFDSLFSSKGVRRVTQDAKNCSDSVPYLWYDYVIILQQLKLLKQSAVRWKLNVSALRDLRFWKRHFDVFTDLRLLGC